MGPSETDEALLERLGWVVECKSPFEIRHTDGSFATLNAAEIVLLAAKAGELNEDQ